MSLRKESNKMLELIDITKTFDDKTVLNNISLNINTGEIVSILGSSGSGKTTLLNIILGILKQDSGNIVFNGENISNKPLAERDFNIVFQDYALFPHLNAYENIIYGLKNQKGNKKPIDKSTVDETIELFDLNEHLDKRISELSGGQKQRVALARTIVMRPQVLLLDEPLSALDGVIKETIKELIKRISRKYNLTTIIVTHDPEEALTLSDKVLILNQGKIAQYDEPVNIIKNSKSEFIETFILKQLEIKYANIQSLFGSESTVS